MNWGPKFASQILGPVIIACTMPLVNTGVPGKEQVKRTDLMTTAGVF